MTQAEKFVNNLASYVANAFGGDLSYFNEDGEDELLPFITELEDIINPPVLVEPKHCPPVSCGEPTTVEVREVSPEEFRDYYTNQIINGEKPYSGITLPDGSTAWLYIHKDEEED